MNKKNRHITVMFAIAVSFLSTMFTAVFLSRYYRDSQFQLLGSFCQMLMEEHASDAATLLAQIKEHKSRLLSPQGENLLASYGYQAADFTGNRWGHGYGIALLCFASGVIVFLSAFFYWHKKEAKQLQALSEYLERVYRGGPAVLYASEESESGYSRLRDEIYKTVTALHQARDAALVAKRNFAENLYNIAHQLKTPVTAISLSAQMLEETYSQTYPKQIQKQVLRLSHLEEALLLLSRIDAGTLVLERKKTDVFTLLNLAADHLQELFNQSGVTVDIPETGETEITVDVEWTMEACMNLLKNCMEHSPAGAAVHCAYEKNPLYVQIRIWDEGNGFAKEDILHLFERFYRGKHARKEGIGIGLSLAKAIIEMQNGTIRAGNLPEGGAYFEIHMYCH